MSPPTIEHPVYVPDQMPHHQCPSTEGKTNYCNTSGNRNTVTITRGEYKFLVRSIDLLQNFDYD